MTSHQSVALPVNADLLKRLREDKFCIRDAAGGVGPLLNNPLSMQAADEIERLKAILNSAHETRLEMALELSRATEKIANMKDELADALAEPTALRIELDEARQAISDCSTWIPVAERVPSLRAYVVAWETAGTLHCTIAQYRGTAGWYGPWGEKIQVTHWQPLPEAP